MTHRHAIIYTGGDAPHERAHRTAAAIETADNNADLLIIAADSGWEHAIASGRTPNILVGDMDSISAAHLAQARASHADVIVHDPDKDETDTEIALATAIDNGATHITVIAGGGDRPDHVFAMLHSLASARFASARIDGHLGASRFHVCHAHQPVDIHTQPGDTVSLLPVGGDAVVSADNLKWPLVRETLHAHASRGVSNVATGRVDIAVHEGTLIAFTTPPTTHGDPQ
jgi:thiamine pyrophosphokinase